MLGVWVAAVVGLIAHLVVVLSGSAFLETAELAELATHEELAKQRLWRVVHRLLLREHGDIDHVAIGPAGVVVVETKWSLPGRSSAREQRWLDEAATQVAENARLVWLLLRPVIKAAPVRAVVVRWPAGSEQTTSVVGDVTVMPGHALRGWMDALPEAQLDDETVRAAWEVLSEHLRRRDAADRERYGPPLRSIWDYAAAAWQWTGGVFAGLFAAGVIASTFDVIPAVAAAAAAIVVAAGLRNTVPKFGRSATAFLVGVACFAVLIVVAIGIALAANAI